MATARRSVLHRWMGPAAPALHRVLVVATAGLLVTLVLLLFVSWHLALLLGWDAAALLLLGVVWHAIVHADGPGTEALAMQEDLTRDTARIVLLAASVASLAALGLAITLVNDQTGADRLVFVAVATLTVVLSWTVVNTVFLLRYADLYYSGPTSGIDFGASSEQPDYRDFAYLAFTIGMCYQVSDTSLRDKRLRRTVLAHSLLSYVYGVVIVATGVNIVAGLS